MSDVDYDDVVATPPDISTVDSIHRPNLRHALYPSVGSIIMSVSTNKQLPSLSSPEATASCTSATFSSSILPSSPSPASHFFGIASDAWLEATLSGLCHTSNTTTTKQSSSAARAGRAQGKVRCEELG